MQLAAVQLSCGGPKNWDDSFRVLNRGSRKLERDWLGGIGVMEYNQQPFAATFARERIKLVTDRNMLLRSDAECRMFLTELQQSPHLGEDVLFLGCAAFAKKSIVRIPRKSSGKIAAIVGIISACERYFIPVIELWNSAQGCEQRESQLEFVRRSSCLGEKTHLVVIVDEGHKLFGMRVEAVLAQNGDDLLC